MIGGDEVWLDEDLAPGLEVIGITTLIEWLALRKVLSECVSGKSYS